jgi:hypothetical protein
MKPHHVVLIALTLGGPLAPSTQAADRYYLIVFGSQTQPHSHRHTHTFALFIKTRTGDQDNQEAIAETKTISWMPRTLRIRLLSQTPEPGVNLSVEQSVRWARSVGADTWMWGPFEIGQELYRLADAQVARLEAGKIKYVCLDKQFRGTGATNCIHALTDLDTTQPALDTGNQSGNSGSQAAVDHLMKHVVSSEVSADRLVEQLRLRQLGIKPASEWKKANRSR